MQVSDDLCLEEHFKAGEMPPKNGPLSYFHPLCTFINNHKAEFIYKIKLQTIETKTKTGGGD